MASYYVYSGAAGAANGTSWANAYTTLAAAVAGGTTGDIFYIAHDHYETTAGSLTVASAGFNNRVLCVNRAGSVPPVAADLTTGAVIEITGGFTAINFSGNRTLYHGITFYAGSGSSAESDISSTGFNGTFEACHFRLGSTGGGSSRIRTGKVTWRNCTVQFGATNAFIQPDPGGHVWINTPNAIVGAVIPTSLIKLPAGGGLHIEGVDLSAVPSGKSIADGTSVQAGVNTLRDCKLAAGVTVCTGNTSWQTTVLDAIRCDSTGNYRHERYHGCGIQTVETTIIRSGGASDGVTPISWRIVTNGDSTIDHPFESMPTSVWNEDTGVTKTITVEGVWGGGSVPDNDDIWIQVEYLGDASTPKGSFVSSGVVTILTAPSSYASSSETWGGSTTPFKMSVTTGTIQLKGPITVRIFAALPSSTFYVDPKIAVT